MICGPCTGTLAPQCLDVCEDTLRLRSWQEYVDKLPADLPLEERATQITATRPYPSCDCQHGHPIEQGGDMDPESPEYVDALPPDDPRRIAYEARVRRRISA